jgi:hypothetical protein
VARSHPLRELQLRLGRLLLLSLLLLLELEGGLRQHSIIRQQTRKNPSTSLLKHQIGCKNQGHDAHLGILLDKLLEALERAVAFKILPFLILACTASNSQTSDVFVRIKSKGGKRSYSPFPQAGCICMGLWTNLQGRT